jgi:hypothetical protein
MEVASEGGDIGVFFANGIGDHISASTSLPRLCWGRLLLDKRSHQEADV